MSFEGDLQSVALPWVLQRVAAETSTGILTVQGEEDIVAVSLLKGEVVAADALNQTVEEGLEAALVSQDAINKENFAAVVQDYQGGSSGSLGEMLIQRGLISRDQLLNGLRLQTYRLMTQILSWETGEYKFYSGDEVSYEEGFQPISIEELLVRSLKEHRESRNQRLDLPSPDQILRRLPPSGELKILGRDGDGVGPGIWLTERQVAFLERLNGTRSVAQAAESVDLKHYPMLFCLYRLQQEALIESTTGVLTSDAAVGEASVGESTPSQMSELEADLRAEIFMPPDPAEISAVHSVRLELESLNAPVAMPGVLRQVVPVLAILLALALAIGLVLRPDSLLFPFPWQSEQRQTFARTLRESLFLKIDRAAKSFFLFQAHYPDRLEELAQQGLIADADLRDPVGHRLSYEADELRYRLTPLDGEEGGEFERSEGITGDFLLDPQFTTGSVFEKEALYLID